MHEQEQQEYTNQLLKELNIHTLSDTEQQKALEIISERFRNVIIYTTLGALSPEQKKEYSAALDLKSPEKENKITEITSMVPNLKSLIDDALKHEYEALKYAVNK